MKGTIVGIGMALAFIGLGLGARAAEGASLKVGDPAPKLQSGKFLQGERVKEFEPGKAYIVEFWATWCGPCVASIPHVNEIHTKYKDKGLVVIGQNVWERDESLVEPFIKKMGEKMTYRVALDNKEGSKAGKMAETWMEAAGQNGIPAAFLVDTKGRIAWIGHPMTLQESQIEEVLSGKFDIDKAAADYRKEQSNASDLQGLSRDLNAAFRAKNWDRASEIIDRVETMLPKEQRSQMAMPRLMVSLGKKDLESADALASKVAADKEANPMLLNAMAWELATYEGIKGPALETAAKLATKANESAEGKDPAVLDTLARVKFLQGDKEKAKELEQKAVELADGELKEALQKSLDSYNEGKLPETF